MAPHDPDRDVLSSLPRTRPQRRSAKRDATRAKASAASKPKPKATRKVRARAGSDRPRRMPPSGFAPPSSTAERRPPSGPELIGTAIQAVAELAQIGMAVGGHALRGALDRLPKP